MIDKEDCLLVSCTVVSYNSQDTILETLDSIKNQTYGNIELIVSDDCSTDNTLAICREWIEKNKKRFVRTELLTVDKNTGVAGNGNRAMSACRGVWQKGIAADDILLPNCVEDFMRYVADHPDAKWISSRIRKYDEIIDEEHCIGRNLSVDPSFFEKDTVEQLNVLARGNVIYAPSLFFNLAFKRSIGYDSTYRFEDLPFYVNALEKGYKCHFMDKETIGYRVHQSSSNSSTKLFNYSSELEFRRFRKCRTQKYLTKRQLKGQQLSWRVTDIFECLGMNKKTTLNIFLYVNINKIINRIFIQ